MTARTHEPAAALEVAGITKAYGDHVVLRGIDLTVPTGTVYALLGPNGAGKTTLVRILSTLVAADAGTARVAGFDVASEADGVRRSIGVTGQFSAIDELLTGRENLRLMADLAHLRSREAAARVDDLLARFGLAEAADRRAATYSGGMRRRLDLAMTLVSRPRTIFLDEPTTGLDPRSRRDLWEIVRELLADGVTILLTTQYLEEADQLAHTVGLLDDGRLVATGTPAELKAMAGGETLDDVFLALTGHAAQDTDGADPMTALTYTATDSFTMLRRNLKHLVRYPSLTLMIIGMPLVFLLLFVYVFGGTMGAGLPGAAHVGGGTESSASGRQKCLPPLRHARDPRDDRRVGRQQHRDPGGQGRHRGHHRPLPDDADRPLGAADRPRARRDGADGRGRGGRAGARGAARLPGRVVGGRLGRRRGHPGADGLGDDLARRSPSGWPAAASRRRATLRCR